MFIHLGKLRKGCFSLNGSFPSLYWDDKEVIIERI